MIEAGQRLLHYRIVEKIGEGGMGVIWKAIDTSLDREVAIKVLPESLENDPERLARFQKEARVLASLNHTNIAAVFGLYRAPVSGSGKETGFLAMELVPGEDLAQLIQRGPLLLEDALRIARQIAEGLEAAHRSGIVHRDLKPANVMLTPEGNVKVLDFGLAKALAKPDPVSGSSDSSSLPTMTSAGTVAGTILGTASYMSPEQARGRPVDRRADIWSLGAILYETLTGRKAFEGESVPEILASVLRSELDLEALPSTVPRTLRRLLRRCLAKNPRQRLHDVADFRIELDEILSSGFEEADAPQVISAPRAGRASTAVALVFAALALAYAWFDGSQPVQAPRSAIRLEIPATMLDFSAAALPFALSPDGETLVYVDYDGPATRLFLRRMNSFEVEKLTGTEGASAPFYSPGGEWIGFFASGEIRKISTAGGLPITLCPAPHSPGGATWLEDDTIVFSMAFTPTGLYRVSADGGPVETIAIPAKTEDEHNFRDPHALPGGKLILFMISGQERMQAGILSLEDGQRRLLSGVGGRARYAPGGFLVYGDTESLLAAPFDASSGEITGAPVTALEGVRLFQGGASFAVSRAGTLAYLPALPDSFDYVWIDREGNAEPTGVDDNHGSRPVLSHDGRRLTVSGGTSARGAFVHVYDLERGGRIRLPGVHHTQWSPDDTELFTMLRSGGALTLARMRSDGSGKPTTIHTSEHNCVPTGISMDGQWLLFYEQNPETSRDVWVLRLDGSGEATPLVATWSNERAAVFSRDGRFFAYTSDASGRDEVYVRPFDPSGEDSAKYLISTNGGREAQWSRDGKELFYRVGQALMAVSVETAEFFRAGEARKLFEGNWGVETGGMNQMYDVGLDRDRFLMVKTAEGSNRVNVVLGWAAELEKTR